MPNPKQSLILGGARSGKSAYAEQLAKKSEPKVVYIATATTGDTEMEARIRRHKDDRPTEWLTIEEPLSLAHTLQTEADAERVLLVDCLTLWVTNLLCHADPERFEHETQAVLNLLPTLPGKIIMVSNEVGYGIVPMGELSRRFVDETGRLHQQLAARMDQVILMVAGLPLTIKG
ncbi:MAG: Adenosylcobinamide-phosphate guanylyltransferase (EC [uncultured Thiotrichaceae bacterium]|uniref:Bifunctional adenosylcobalamin biosynthesis protein n=1 Tax=uncultured Thiotrichaceae bacterium TaxID=298394 RepID=A0A6S6TLJ9_9GAMM|nr:MAG: Adenosylcobinamide-phosphate guanylyltransferase (EC [uncultured Thiotrichaceae bacterium]